MSRSRDTANIIHGGTFLLDGDDPLFLIKQSQTSSGAGDTAGVYFENADTTLSDYTRPYIRFNEDKLQLGAEDLTNGGYQQAIVAYMKDGVNVGFSDLDLRAQGTDIKLVGDDYAVSGSYLAFRTATTSGSVTEGMRLTPSGELLIGTTTDSGDYKLQVAGNTLVEGDLTVENGGSALSSTGAIRLSNNHGIGWRNNANDDDKKLFVSTTDDLEFNGNIVASTNGGATLAMVGNDGNSNNGFHAEWDDTNSRFIHHITYNDGAGNFNIRIGNMFDGTNTICTEVSYPVHIICTQSDGSLKFNMMSTSKAVGDTVVFDKQFVFDRDGNFSCDGEVKDGTEWTALTLQNSWVNYGSGHADAAYRVSASGEVEVKGLVKSGSAANVTIATLLLGPRP